MHRAIGRSSRQSAAREVDDELAFHLDMRTRQLIGQGVPPDEARREALRHFGDLERVRTSCVTYDQERLSAMQRANVIDEIRQDLSYAVRTIRRNAGFATVVALTIALGIGANTAIFSLVHAVMLRTLPVPAADSLVALGDPAATGSVFHSSAPQGEMFTYRGYTLLRERSRAFSGMLASGRADRVQVITDQAQGEPDRPRARFVSANYFQVLRVPAMQGRTFDGSEDASVGASPVVTVSHSYWTRKLAADPRAVGREILINGARFTVIGVTPEWFTGEIVGQSIDIWIPVTMQTVVMPKRAWLTESEAYWLILLARRAPGVTLTQADAMVQRDMRGILGEIGSFSAKDLADVTVPVSPGARGFSRVRESYGQALVTLMIGVGLLLLIICANVANLLLARALSRSREMSVRLAIGAGRGRLVRQLLTESLVLGALGAAGGLLLARWGSRLLLALASDGSPAIPLDTRLDLPVIAFTGAVSIVAVVLFGLVPALRTSRVDLATVLRASARSLTGASGGWARQFSTGQLLIAAQVGLSLVLLIGASLLVRSLQHVQNAPTGLDRDHLVIVDVDAQSRGYAGDRLLTFTRDMSQRLARVPGVAAVSWSENGVFSGTESHTTFQVPGFVAKAEDDTSAAYDQVGPAYVRALGARMERGRDISEEDIATRAPVVMINGAMARFFFGASDPIGRSIQLGDSGTVQVVGVVADVRDHQLTSAPERRFYVPAVRNRYGDPTALSFEIRTTGAPGPLVPAIRKAIAEFDPLLLIEDAGTLDFAMRQSVREERLLARLAAGFGLLALLLASVGLYGVMTYSISRRVSEIGLRVALGAQRAMVLRMVLMDAMRLVGMGVLIGVPLGLAAARLLRAQLHGVESADTVSIAVALTVLILSAAIAALLPALRASRVTPLVALQQD